MAIALGLQPERALLCDVNPHLINFHPRLSHPHPFAIAMLNDERFYYAQRAVFNALVKLPWGMLTAEAAEIFYYLNRTGFNGLCRFNRSGEFNVPFGKYAAIDYRTDFSEYAPLVQRWDLRCQPFEVTLAALEPSDFLYIDPPYDETFADYSAGGFTWEQQVRLAERAAQHAGPVVASNSATARVLELYRSLGFTVETTEVKRSIAASGNRDAAMEMLAMKNIDSRKEAGLTVLAV
jgi:DNA adenine methylase